MHSSVFGAMGTGALGGARGPGFIELSATQGVAIFGFTFNVQLYLTWNDVRADLRLTFRFLRACGLSPEMLHRLQPDAKAWVDCGKVDAKDCTDMTMWPLLPIFHLDMDLADIMRQRWTVDELVVLGVDYKALESVGLNAQIMHSIALPLKDWKRLGLRYQDVHEWSDSDIHHALTATRGAVAQVLVSQPAL